MTPAEPPRNHAVMPENRDRLPSAEQALFRATTMVVAPVSAYRRPLRMLQPPVAVEAEAKTNSPSVASPAQDDLEQIMVKLKAAAARAEEAPLSGVSNRHLVIAAAIALSMISGAVTAQYLVPGHARPSIALSTAK